MKVTEIDNDQWFLMELTEPLTVLGKNVVENILPSGGKGYVKRNSHDPRYFQVLARNTQGNIMGEYVREDNAIRLLEVKRPAPAHATPDAYWHTFWATKFG